MLSISRDPFGNGVGLEMYPTFAMAIYVVMMAWYINNLGRDAYLHNVPLRTILRCERSSQSSVDFHSKIRREKATEI